MLSELCWSTILLARKQSSQCFGCPAATDSLYSKSQKGPDHQATHTRVPQDSWYSKWKAKAIERDSNTMIWKARRNLSHASLVVCTYVYRHNIYRCMPTERCSFCKQIWMTKTNRFPTLHSEMVHIILWSGNVLFISDIKWYMLAKKAAPGVRCMHYITRGHMWMLFVYVLWNKIRGVDKEIFLPHPACQNLVSYPQLVLKSLTPAITVSHWD